MTTTHRKETSMTDTSPLRPDEREELRDAATRVAGNLNALLDQLDAAEARAGTAEAEARQLRHLLGSHADGHRCTCTMTSAGDHISPPEWEQDPWCLTHPAMDTIVAEHKALERTLEKVRAYADERAAYGRRGRTVHSARIASDLHGILVSEARA